MDKWLEICADIARAIPGDMAAHRKAYRYELRRRLELRGWKCEHAVSLEPGSRGDDTYLCGRLELVCTPPPRIEQFQSEAYDTDGPASAEEGITQIQYPPVLVQIERNQISYRTRAKLQSWGQRPTSGKLVLQLYAIHPDPIPEADLVIALHHTRLKYSQAYISAKADTRRLSHAVGVNEARYQRNKARMLQARRDAGGRPGMRAKRLAAAKAGGQA